MNVVFFCDAFFLLTGAKGPVASLGVVAPKAAVTACATRETQLPKRMVAMAKEDLVSAQKLAELAGESYNTIDYWTERKLLSCERVGRTRQFDRESCLRRIKTIRNYQRRGYSIEAILDEVKRQKL